MPVTQSAGAGREAVKSAGTGVPLLPSLLRSLVALVGVTTLTFFTFHFFHLSFRAFTSRFNMSLFTRTTFVEATGYSGTKW